MVRIKPVKRKSLVDTVVERIRGVIGEGQSARRSAADRGGTGQAARGQPNGAPRSGRPAGELGLVSVQGSRGMFVSEPGGLLNGVNLVRSAMACRRASWSSSPSFAGPSSAMRPVWPPNKANPDDIAELEMLCEEIRRADLHALRRRSASISASTASWWS